MRGDDLQEWTIDSDMKTELDKILLAGTVPQSMRQVESMRQVDNLDGLKPENRLTHNWVEYYAALLRDDLVKSENTELDIAASREMVNGAKEGLWMREVEAKKRFVFYV
jgi:hypothetical protein